MSPEYLLCSKTGTRRHKNKLARVSCSQIEFSFRDYQNSSNNFSPQLTNNPGNMIWPKQTWGWIHCSEFPLVVPTPITVSIPEHFLKAENTGKMLMLNQKRTPPSDQPSGSIKIPHCLQNVVLAPSKQKWGNQKQKIYYVKWPTNPLFGFHPQDFPVLCYASSLNGSRGRSPFVFHF